MSGIVLVDGIRWRNVINYIYSSIVNLKKKGRRNLFSNLPLDALRTKTQKCVDEDMWESVSSAKKIAYGEKFKDPDLIKVLKSTGSVKLTCGKLFQTSSTSAPERAIILEKIREDLHLQERNHHREKDRQTYHRRIQQCLRLVQAMTKILYEGDSLVKFRHFNISSIPQELARPVNIDPHQEIPPEIKSAALSQNGSVLYNFVRRKELRKYKDELPNLKSTIAVQELSNYILETRYPHFYKEAVAKHTGSIKGKLNTIKLSLENDGLTSDHKRFLLNELEECQNELKNVRSKLTKSRLYRKQSELLGCLPQIGNQILQLHEAKQLPSQVSLSIDQRFNKLYIPTELEVQQAESWTHRCLTFQENNDSSFTQRNKNQLGEYNISKTELPELLLDYEVQLVIEGNIYHSALHYVIFHVLRDIYRRRFAYEIAEDMAGSLLKDVSGSFIGIQESISRFQTARDETFEYLMLKGCQKGLAAWVEQSPSLREILKENKGKTIIYKSPNPILGSGNGTEDGKNMVGETLTRLAQLQ